MTVMTWNHYAAAAVFSSLVLLACGAPPLAVLIGLGAVGLYNLLQTGRAR